MPPFDLEPARLLCLFARHVTDALGEGPHMTFRIARAIGAVAIELVGRFPED
jgi:hypothetical protein